MARARALAAAFAAACAGCGGGIPLLHPARTLNTGEVRGAGGLSANVAVGSLGSALQTAQDEAGSRGAPSPADPQYARGAFVAAVVAPGIAPFVAARVGVGNSVEGGIGYTGRGVRIDARRSFDAGAFSFSAGAAVDAAFYGRNEASTLPNVDLSAVHGFGADVPLLVGWQSAGGIYQAWAGVRGGWDHTEVGALSSQPPPGEMSTIAGLTATRFYGGALVGLATGFRHVHVAFEFDVAYQSIDGYFDGAHATLQGLTLAPATAVWWDF